MQAASILEEDAGSEVEQVVRRNLAKELHPGKDCPGYLGDILCQGLSRDNCEKALARKVKGMSEGSIFEIQV